MPKRPGDDRPCHRQPVPDRTGSEGRRLGAARPGAWDRQWRTARWLSSAGVVAARSAVGSALGRSTPLVRAQGFVLGWRYHASGIMTPALPLHGCDGTSALLRFGGSRSGGVTPCSIALGVLGQCPVRRAVRTGPWPVRSRGGPGPQPISSSAKESAHGSVSPSTAVTGQTMSSASRSRLYGPLGREGYPPLAIVFTK